MSLERWIQIARDQGASDLHLEAGMSMAVRVDGKLRSLGKPVGGRELVAVARTVIGEAAWPGFLERRSHDGSRLVAGVQCRINVLATSRGVGMAIRLLRGAQPTLDSLNLHPDLSNLVRRHHGLVLVCGPTGSGKSSTLAALIHAVNTTSARHVLTIERPIEYRFRPRKAFIRQREVGRDTPSFEQALLDALREDPDVLMVGEMRQRQTMQLTLDAAETGHLVLSTLHSSTAAEALQRIVGAFPAEAQASVRAQLADCLAAVLCQRLQYRADLDIRVPECELLVSTAAVRAHLREGRLHKLSGAMELGGTDGMWTFERYRRWLATRTTWVRSTPAHHETVDPVEQTALPPLATARAPERAEGDVRTTAKPRHEDLDAAESVSALIAELENRTG